MKLALSSYVYNWAIGVPGYLPEQPMTVFDLLDQAVQLGVHVVQVADNIPFEQLPREEQVHFADLATQNGIEIEVGIRGIQGSHLEEGIDLAKRLHARVLRVALDKGDYRPGEDEIVQAIQAVVPMLQKSEVSMAVENTGRFKARGLVQLIERIGNQYVGICLDTTNNFGIGEGIEAVVETLGPLTLDLHLKDYSIHRMSHLMGFILEGCPAGQGQLDSPWILKELGRCGRDPNVVLELWTSPEASLEETINKEKEWADQSIKYLRSLIPD
jgi:sugar phosphate isomerase/epimerase